jgi:hypothetical protein
VKVRAKELKMTQIIEVEGNQAVVEKSGKFWILEDPNGKVTKCATIEKAKAVFKKFLYSDIS